MKRLTLIFRTIKKNAKLNTLVVFSMALGLLTAGIIMSHVYQEFHYDSENPNSGNIYRVVGDGAGYAALAQRLKEDFPDVLGTVRVSFFYGYLACSTEKNKVNETSAIFADPDFFNLFSFPLLKGNARECLQAPGSIVISESAAHKYFAENDPVGKQIKIGKDSQFTVTGVFRDFKANSNFRGDIILPLQIISKLTQIWIEPSWKYESDIHSFVFLAADAKISHLEEMISRTVLEHTQQSANIRLQSLKDIHVESTVLWESTAQVNVTYLYILIAIAILILYISGSNFLFLFVGIKSQQRISTAIKKVCGASRFVLFLEYFTEVFFLMAFSLILALVFYVFYHDLAGSVFPFLPQIVFFDFDLLLILVAVVVVVAVLSGSYPAFVLSSQMPVRIFSQARENKSAKVKFVNKLVVAQFSLCIALIVTTMIMDKQVYFMENQQTGYAKDELLTIPLNMHIGDGIYNEKFELFARELKKYPGIKNVTMAFSSPSSVITSGDTPPDWQGKDEGQKVEMHWESVSYDYFETIGVKITKGRSFNADFPGDAIDWDTRRGSFMLNQSAVKAMAISDPIGKEFSVWGFKGPIIGVVEDYNFQSLRSGITPMFYEVNPFFLNEIIVRIDLKSASVLEDIKTVWERFVPGYPLEFHFVSDKIRALYQPEKNLAGLLNLFSVTAIGIAAMGLFALTLLSINKRIKEIGIRKVVGASVPAIVFLLSRDFLKLVVLANVIAWPLAWYAMSNWLQTFAYRIDMTVWVFVIAGMLALLLALITVSFQTIKAAWQNPVESLRYE